MKRALAGIVVCSLAASVLVVTPSCEDSTESACKVDTDCPQGTICREGRCGATSPGGGAATTDAAPSTCSSDGLPCNTVDECCSRTCTNGRCGVVTPPPAPTCKNLYELCQNDCCQGLTCTAGACR